MENSFLHEATKREGDNSKQKMMTQEIEYRQVGPGDELGLDSLRASIHPGLHVFG